jgi:hypothetical protein
MIIIRSMFGWSVAIGGEMAVGKTRLHEFFENGEIPDVDGELTLPRGEEPVRYEQTVTTEKLKGRKVKLKDLGFKIGKQTDIPGEGSEALWEHLVWWADLVLYLTRSDCLRGADPQTRERVRDDLAAINKWTTPAWYPPRITRPWIFLVGTFADTDSKFRGMTANDYGTYLNNFRNLTDVQRAVAAGGGKEVVTTVVGSLKTKNSTEELVYYIMQRMFK